LHAAFDCAGAAGLSVGRRGKAEESQESGYD
jgi:hypothetical protein